MKYDKIFIYLFIPFYLELTCRSDPSTDGLNDADSHMDVPFACFVDIAALFGVKYKTPILGCEKAFSSQTCKILKVSYYQNDSRPIDFTNFAQ